MVLYAIELCYATLKSIRVCPECERKCEKVICNFVLHGMRSVVSSVIILLGILLLFQLENQFVVLIIIPLLLLPLLLLGKHESVRSEDAIALRTLPSYLQYLMIYSASLGHDVYNYM